VPGAFAAMRGPSRKEKRGDLPAKGRESPLREELPAARRQAKGFTRQDSWRVRALFFLLRGHSWANILAFGIPEEKRV
jgi:hypothetical protein